jgi:hypothetical protein
MRPESRLGSIALVLGFAACSWLGERTVVAQDVANGLWQSYRYPASNPNWRRQYEEEVAHWGYDPQGLRPAYRSSPDMMWGNQPGGATSPFGNAPYYTVSHWDPYIPRPVDWTGLEYGGAGAPPESTTGNHGWYGPSAPGPRSEVPKDWREWEQNTPEGRRYLEQNGLRAPDDRPIRNGPGVLPAQEKSAFKQYFRAEQPKAGVKIWQAHESRIPADPNELPVQAEDETGGFKQYVLNRTSGPGQGRWQVKQGGVVRPRPLGEPTPSRIMTPAPEHSGFTQYSVKLKPGPGQGRWEVKSKKPAPEPAAP